MTRQKPQKKKNAARPCRKKRDQVMGIAKGFKKDWGHRKSQQDKCLWAAEEKNRPRTEYSDRAIAKELNHRRQKETAKEESPLTQEQGRNRGVF